MIERYLSIIEVSQKQAYIFGSNKLKENIERSAEISWLTDPKSIEELIGDEAVFHPESNKVYAGGGHTVLVFDTLEKARDFNSRYSFLLRTMNPEIEVFLFTLPYCSRVSAKRMLDYVFSEKERSQEKDEKFAEDEASNEAIVSEECTPDSYLKALVEGLERKKSLRRASFRQGSFGIEKLDSETRGIVSGRKVISDSGENKERDGQGLLSFVNRSGFDGSPCSAETQMLEMSKYEEARKLNGVVAGSNPVPDGFAAATKFENLGGTKGDVNFLAVVHIDGNGMGARCNDYYKSLQERYLKREKKQIDENLRWKDFQSEVEAFSRGIDEDFKSALKKMFERVGSSLNEGRLKELTLKTKGKTQERFFPIRGIIASGDDICFVTDGRIGIECAAVFLEELSSLKNQKDNKPYSASAGVAIVHQKYPFFRAYELAEMLCANAKSFASDLREKQKEACKNQNISEAVIPSVLEDNGAGICAIDWHLEMGEIGMSLDEIRKGYLTKDSVEGSLRHLEMRPYIVTVTSDAEAPADAGTIEPHRQYAAFKEQMKKYLSGGSLSGDAAEDVYSKLKELRGILKQGEAKAQHFIRFHKLKGLAVDSYYGIFKEIQLRTDTEKIPLYVKTADGDERSVLFDAAEALEIYSLM